MKLPSEMPLSASTPKASKSFASPMLPTPKLASFLKSALPLPLGSHPHAQSPCLSEDSPALADVTNTGGRASLVPPSPLAAPAPKAPRLQDQENRVPRAEGTPKRPKKAEATAKKPVRRPVLGIRLRFGYFEGWNYGSDT